MLVWEDFDLDFKDFCSKKRGVVKKTYIGTYQAIYGGKGHGGKGRDKEIIWTDIKLLSGKCIYHQVPTELSEARYKFHWARLT